LKTKKGLEIRGKTPQSGCEKRGVCSEALLNVSRNQGIDFKRSLRLLYRNTGFFYKREDGESPSQYYYV
jgi:hypothetical protein